MGIIGGLQVMQVQKYFDALDRALGKRCAAIHPDASPIDLSTMGIWAYAMKNKNFGEEDKIEWLLITDPGDLPAATHVYHKYAKVPMLLSHLGVKQKLDANWRIEMNYKDEEAYMSDGEDLSVKLWKKFKDLPYYKDLDARVSKEYGGNSWTEFFGTELATKRKAAAKEISEAQAALQAKAEEPMLAGFTTPTKRKRVKGPV